MKDLEQKVVEIIDQLQGIAKPAMQTAIASIQAGGVMYIITGAVCAILCVVACKLCFMRIKIANDKSGGEDIPHIFAAVVLGIFSLGLGIAACVNLLDPGNWLAAIRPDLSLARALLTKVL